MNIRREFEQYFSKSAFQVVDGETRIIGKWGQLSIVDDLFDLWFIGRDKPLTEHRMSRISAAVGGGITRLTREGWVQTKDKSKALQWAVLLGVRKRQTISPERRAKAVENLKTARKSSHKTTES